MAGKRQATSDLNHNNWDQEEEPEDAGHFKEADEDELKKRVIKKARRRIPEASTEESGTKSIFGGFTGFGKTTTQGATSSNNAASLFSFLNKIPAPAIPAASNTQSTAITTTTTTAPAKTTTPFSFGLAAATADNKPKNDTVDAAKDTAYFAKVIKLNQTFCDWIKKHVDEQPLCNLISTFRDYEKYWEELKQEKPSEVKISNAITSTTTPSIFSNIKFNATTASPSLGFGASTSSKDESNVKTNGLGNGSSNTSPLKFPSNGNTTAPTLTFGSPPKTNASPSFSFGLKTDEKPSSSTGASTTTGFSFGQKKIESTPPTAAPFSFGLKKDDKPTTSGFSFTAGSVPFSFGNIKPPAAVATDAGADADEKDDDEDEPPKVEVKEIVEDDAIYTKKCKFFVKKDNAYKDFGISTLYLKKVPDSSKIQLLVRSSNNLGTILMNLLLVEGMPTQRVGKNNVMIIHPNKEGETQTSLIRVKDGTEADELLETINKHKK